MIIKPEEKIAKMLRRLPPEDVDEISDEIIEYIRAWESGFVRNFREIHASHAGLMTERVPDVQNREPLFSPMKPWQE